MVKNKILVVDDEEDVTFLLSSLLEFHDFSVTTRNNPAGVIEELEKNSYTLIVTDYMMPGLDGLKLCQEIRRSLKTKDLHIMMLTAKGLTHDEHQKLLELNVYIVKKPYQPNELVTKIKEMTKQ